MNWIRQNIDNLSHRHYIIKADRNSKYWFGLSKNKIDKLKIKYNSNFNIILKGSDIDETDFYVIPYNEISDLLVNETLYLFKDRQRWVGDIKNHVLSIRNSSRSRNLSYYYSNPKSLSGLSNSVMMENNNLDYSIENFKRQISVRLKQSKFRREVLNNFNNKCCLTHVIETDLLVASHIIPWSDSITDRLDPRNGLSLSVLYDKLFDSGYFSFDEEFRVIITSRFDDLSGSVKNWLCKISNNKMTSTVSYKISQMAIKYHRESIFDTF